MALNKNAPKDTPEFDGGEGEEIGGEDTQAQTPGQRLKAAADARAAAAAAETATKAEPKTKPTSGSTAVAPAAGTQLAPAAPMVNPLEPLKNAFFVEFDTLRSLKITSGNVVDQQTGKALGDLVGLELLSYQDQWVVSPGVDGDAGKEHVRYSDDGKTTSKGENCDEYLQQLKDSGFDEAKISKRLVICGSLFDIGEKGRKTLPDMQDTLVQLSLAPTSKAGFDRYMMDQAFKIRKGLIQPTGADRIKIECQPASKGDKDWTVATFSRYDD